MEIEEKLETLQRLIKVPNVDDDPKESIRFMKMLNLIVEIRHELATLKPTESAELSMADVGQSFYCHRQKWIGEEKCSNQCENCIKDVEKYLQ